MVCEMQTVYNKKNSLNSIQITKSEHVNNWIREVYPVDLKVREAMVAIFLNRRNNTIGFQITSIGGFTSIVVDIRIVLQTALLSGATSIILCHNHPTGNLEPSLSDKELTDKFKKACEVMDIQLMDHLILTEDSYYSFLDEGLL